jgi:hypothetical protein
VTSCAQAGSYAKISMVEHDGSGSTRVCRNRSRPAGIIADREAETLPAVLEVTARTAEKSGCHREPSSRASSSTRTS